MWESEEKGAFFGVQLQAEGLGNQFPLQHYQARSASAPFIL